MPYRKGLALATIAVASAVLFVNAACAPSDPSRSNPTSSAREAPLPGVPAGASTKDIYDAMMVAAKARGLNLQPDEVLVVADSEQSPSFVFTIVADLPALDRATVLKRHDSGAVCLHTWRQISG